MNSFYDKFTVKVDSKVKINLRSPATKESLDFREVIT